MARRFLLLSCCKLQCCAYEVVGAVLCAGGVARVAGPPVQPVPDASLGAAKEICVIQLVLRDVHGQW